MPHSMRKHLRADVIMAAILLAISIAVLVIGSTITLPATAYGTDKIGPRGFAYFIGGTTGALSLVLLITLSVKYIARARMPQASDDDDGSAVAELTGDDPRYSASARRVFFVMGVMFGYVILLPIVGYIPATFVAMATILWSMGERQRRTLVLYPLLYGIAAFLVFDVVLSVRVPRGVLSSLLGALGF